MFFFRDDGDVSELDVGDGINVLNGECAKCH